MTQTYFITGAQGCIGSWIVKALAERGDAPVIFDRSEDTRRLEAIMETGQLETVHFIAGDITDPSENSGNECLHARQQPHQRLNLRIPHRIHDSRGGCQR